MKHMLLISTTALLCSCAMPKERNDGFDESKINCDNIGEHNTENQQTNFPVKIYLAEEFAQNEIDAMYDAINLWNDEVGQTVFSPVIENDEKNIECGYVYVVRLLEPTEYVGFATWDSCNAIVSIYKPQIFYGPKFTAVFAHELGHTLNLEHDEEDHTSIMYPTLWDVHMQEIKPHHIKHVYEAMNCLD